MLCIEQKQNNKTNIYQKIQTQTHEPKHNQLNKNNETQQSQQTTENM